MGLIRSVLAHPYGRLVLVHGDRRPVMHLHDLLGVRDERLQVDRQRILAHHLPTRHGELYHAARNVGVQGAEHNRRPLLLSQPQYPVLGPRTVRDHQDTRPELDGAPLSLRFVPDDDDVAGLHLLAHRVGAHRDHPQLTAGLFVLPGEQLTSKTLTIEQAETGVPAKLEASRDSRIYEAPGPSPSRYRRARLVVHYRHLVVLCAIMSPTLRKGVVPVRRHHVLHHVLDPELDVL